MAAVKRDVEEPVAVGDETGLHRKRNHRQKRNLIRFVEKEK